MRVPVVGGIFRFARRQPLGTFGALVILTLVLVAAFASVIAPADPLAQAQREALMAPGAAHLAGTDQFGRDIFSRLIYGARVSLYVGIGAVLLAVIPATIVGVASAFFGGTFDYLVQRVVDAVQAIPGLILLIVIMTVLGVSLTNIVIALALPASISESRVMRSATTQIANSEYVAAARALGATDARLMFRHILPNIVSPIIVVASLGFGRFILAESTLSFLGYGILPPAPSWGGMLAAEGRAYMFAAPWLLWAPAVALSLVVFGANMFGDALRDELDPRLRGTR
ncbi:MAG: ABC transporter permease [Dehalococcoidia bacterium]